MLFVKAPLRIDLLLSALLFELSGPLLSFLFSKLPLPLITQTLVVDALCVLLLGLLARKSLLVSQALDALL